MKFLILSSSNLSHDRKKYSSSNNMCRQFLQNAHDLDFSW